MVGGDSDQCILQCHMDEVLAVDDMDSRKAVPFSFHCIHDVDFMCFQKLGG